MDSKSTSVKDSNPKVRIHNNTPERTEVHTPPPHSEIAIPGAPKRRMIQIYNRTTNTWDFAPTNV